MYYEMYKIYKTINATITKKNTVYIYKQHLYNKKLFEYEKVDSIRVVPVFS